MKSVSIYTTDTCGYCKMAKEFFEKNGIAFQEFNVGTDLGKRQEMIEKSGQMGVPVITVDGDLIVGFNKPKLQELLNIVPVA
jgi:glutaredoxin-like YruB-family protein